MVTFDQLLETFTNQREPEISTLQGDEHAFGSALWEWNNNFLNNNTFINIFGLDNTDPELTSVKTFVQSLTPAEVLALQSALALAKRNVASYDKAYLRIRFGI